MSPKNEKKSKNKRGGRKIQNGTKSVEIMKMVLKCKDKKQS